MAATASALTLASSMVASTPSWMVLGADGPLFRKGFWAVGGHVQATRIQDGQPAFLLNSKTANNAVDA
ncbi:hypothetical protein CMQ_1775 [Grosmannia clavigera kw1407]|uniref:Uncharacterized protein n=1 Tax=Grosmannia clavigera (strain kw1407 / UAMH 11150) TaxID=655863 RepID=F0XAV8_GROCL|nr:uncharacterized protein CMQ_1775 [Grosmannia clavigera kw1407]EFX05139.1 hypothetical protein CMQ_1775 [Grosmannia clavigera kw1407]